MSNRLPRAGSLTQATLKQRRTRPFGVARFTATLTAVAFVILVSVAATHLHIGPDADEGCAVCAAVIGKLEGPSSPALAAAPSSGAYAAPQVPVAQRHAGAIRVVLPPSCGPPHFA